jgi:DNA-binding transcriptional MerR regulator
LDDKINLTEEMKAQLSQTDHLQHKDRAEVLEYNQCFGDKRELASQFRDVAKLSNRVEKPVLHLSLRLAPGESLSRDQWIDIGREAVKDYGIADHQYICVVHKDTREQHIHIVANRVGFDGKVASDSNSYKKMADLCRKLEKQYELREVLSPRAFLSAEEKLLPRHDQRKEQLREDIRQTLKKVSQFSDFQKKMEGLGYEVIKSRGISFVDEKNVKTKGSEVGFSLSKIEKIMDLKRQLEQRQKKRGMEHEEEETISRETSRRPQITHPDRPSEKKSLPIIQSDRQISNILAKLLEPVPQQGGGHVDYEQSEEYYRRKRKRKGISH